MLQKFKSILVTLLLTVPLLSCNTCEGLEGGWTVMVWLDGDNNLENSAMADFNEMEYGLYLAGLTDPSVDRKIRIIVQVDRHPGYDNNTTYTGSNWSDTRRYRIRPDPENSGEWVSERLDNDMGEVNMGDAAELKDFIEYCHEHFPAENYALILWNHGGGLMKKVSSNESDAAGTTEAISKDICTDDTNDDQLYTGEITDVLTDAHSVKFLGFDACLMGMLEVAYEYRPGVTGKFGADAICFSPAEEQADGWDYVRILTRLGGADSDGDTADPENDPCYDALAVTANEFAALCAKEYADAGSTYNTLQTQTAVDNTLVDNVKAAMDAFAAAIAQESGYKSVIEGIRGSGTSATAPTMNYFTESSAERWKTWPFFDLYDFVLRVKAQSMSTEVNNAADDLMSAISGYILYSYGGISYKGYTSGLAGSTGTTSFVNGSNGLSFFFTDGDGSYSTGTYLAEQWWYTSLDTDTWRPGGNYYGKLDFCSGDGDGVVDNWFELIMQMYHDGDYVNTHPGPAY
ncbi:MAG TPA: clostripain-related cysteine peptidase [Spirochaetota bacterium]|nr:clostripain-related cysteine peptidase [Spirochaetota bacterium]